jgi:hypothetical protein
VPSRKKGQLWLRDFGLNEADRPTKTFFRPLLRHIAIAALCLTCGGVEALISTANSAVFAAPDKIRRPGDDALKDQQQTNA